MKEYNLPGYSEGFAWPMRLSQAKPFRNMTYQRRHIVNDILVKGNVTCVTTPIIRQIVEDWPMDYAYDIGKSR